MVWRFVRPGTAGPGLRAEGERIGERVPSLPESLEARLSARPLPQGRGLSRLLPRQSGEKVRGMSDRNLYHTFTLPADPSECADAQLVLDAATRLRNRLEVLPESANKREAIMRLDRTVMVAMGAFHVHPG